MKINSLIQNKYFIVLSLSLAILFSFGNGFCKEDAASQSNTAQFIEIDGNSLRYIQKGEGEDVLLVHGLPGGIEDWNDIIGILAEKYRVTAFDRPGFGYSSKDNIRATIEQNAETVILLIKKLRLHDVILVGHSYGGSTILRVAIKNPDAAKAYIAIAAVSYPVKGPGFILKMASLPFIGRMLAWISTPIIGKGMVADGLKKAFYPNEEFLTEKLIKSRQKIWLQAKVVSTTAREEVKMNSGVEKSIPGYDKIKKPLYIIQGRDDKVVPAESAIKLHNVIKNSRLIMLEHTGHEVQFVHPDKVIGVVDEAAAGIEH